MDILQKTRFVLSVKSFQFFFFSHKDLWALQVVVHFTADWCAPSKYMAGFFENLALKYPDILFLLVDVDEVKGVKDKMDVKAMPTFLLMKKNLQLDKIVGANADELHKRVAFFAQMVRQSAC